MLARIKQLSNIVLLLLAFVSSGFARTCSLDKGYMNCPFTTKDHNLWNIAHDMTVKPSDWTRMILVKDGRVLPIVNKYGKENKRVTHFLSPSPRLIVKIPVLILKPEYRTQPLVRQKREFVRNGNSGTPANQTHTPSSPLNYQPATSVKTQASQRRSVDKTDKIKSQHAATSSWVTLKKVIIIFIGILVIVCGIVCFLFYRIRSGHKSGATDQFAKSKQVSKGFAIPEPQYKKPPPDNKFPPQGDVGSTERQTPVISVLTATETISRPMVGNAPPSGVIRQNANANAMNERKASTALKAHLGDASEKFIHEYTERINKKGFFALASHKEGLQTIVSIRSNCKDKGWFEISDLMEQEARVTVRGLGFKNWELKRDNLNEVVFLVFS